MDSITNILSLSLRESAERFVSNRMHVGYKCWLVLGLEPFSLSAPSCDWQCTEFSGSIPLSLTCACVELLGLPQEGKSVGNGLLEALYVMAKESEIDEEVLALINVMALVFISLPVC